MSAATKSGTVAAFMRFVFFGGGTGLASSAALVALSDHLSIAVANAVVTVIFTLLATELHSRFTFGAGRARGRVHVQSALSAAVSYLFTTGAMLALHAVQSAPGVLKEQAVYLTASGAAGIARFLFLRFVVTGKEASVPGVAKGAPTTVVVPAATGVAVPAVAAPAVSVPAVVATPVPAPVRVVLPAWSAIVTVALPAAGARPVPTRASLVATA
ncbi:hypothetical protein ACIBSV_01870 [Embleya sp. NPDC050154]|uniref:hypothetical protein n=1 Tax=unclassified Embleya TaxID=2699296 RepID=UPI0037B21755